MHKSNLSTWLCRNKPILASKAYKNQPKGIIMNIMIFLHDIKSPVYF